MKEEKIKYNFTGETVLVTGAGQGIGEAVSRAFAKAGAKLILVDIDKGKIEKLKKELEIISGEDNILTIKTDVSVPEDVKKMVEKSISVFGKIDILFNNAGVNKRIPLKDVTFEEWRNIMKVNLDGVFLVAQAVGNVMIKEKKGKIINSASMSAFIVNEHLNDGVYCTSKAGVGMLTKALAVEWAEYNIEVNAIAPGYTKTPLVVQLIADAKKREALEKRIPQHRFAEPDEIAGAVLYLASSSTTYITGHILLIDGGYTVW